ncbi:MAG: ankyrin repeat domain-containing protein [Bacteroidales bacterium]|nr:ankyrin repeat domain-containing protein [Bacteroidales bacterium]
MKNKINNKNLLTVLAILTGLLLSTNLFSQDKPLYDATIRANIDGVKKALAEGADINKQSDNGYTSLMWACTYSSRTEYAEVAKLLIAEGADVNIPASDGTTALLEAAESSEEVTRLLIERGADINATRDDGRGIITSVVFGILRERADIGLAEFFISKGADVNETAVSGDVEGWAPIHYAVSNGNENLVSFLVKNGADVNAKTKGDLTPLSLARSNEYSTIADILKAAGAK